MKDNHVILSICIPTYNRGERLEKTIREILLYPYDDIEVIVIDDASTDDSVQYLERIADSRLHIIINKKNIGQGLNQAKAIFSGHGKYTMALMDRDYIIVKNILPMLEKLRENSSPIILIGEKKEIWNSSAYKYVYMSCYVTHPSNIIIHSKMLKKVTSFERIAGKMKFKTTPYVYFPPIIGLIMILNYKKYSISDISLTKAMTKGTVSGDCIKAGRKSTDYYLIEGAKKRLQLYLNLIVETNKKMMKIFPWIYAAELHNATLWNLELYNGGTNRVRSGIERYRDDEYMIHNKRIKKFAMKLLEIRGYMNLRNWFLVTGITYLNECRIQRFVFGKKGLKEELSERIWNKVFYSIF